MQATNGECLILHLESINTGALEKSLVRQQDPSFFSLALRVGLCMLGKIVLDVFITGSLWQRWTHISSQIQTEG